MIFVGQRGSMRFDYRFLSVLALLLISGIATDSFACSTSAWNGGQGGLEGTVGSPGSISRYAGYCAFEVTGEAYVQSNLANDQRYIARFYVLNGLEGIGKAVVFRAYSDDAATEALFEVSLDGFQFAIDAGAAGGGSATAAAKPGWNLVEIDWASGGSMSYWINANSRSEQATGEIVSAGSGRVQSVRLGAPDGLGGNSGKLTFDAFESRRSTAIGELLVGDANADGTVDPDDITAIREEFFESGLSVGTPDCNQDGSVNSGDAVCVVNEGFGG